MGKKRHLDSVELVDRSKGNRRNATKQQKSEQEISDICEKLSIELQKIENKLFALQWKGSTPTFDEDGSLSKNKKNPKNVAAYNYGQILRENLEIAITNLKANNNVDDFMRMVEAIHGAALANPQFNTYSETGLPTLIQNFVNLVKQLIHTVTNTSDATVAKSSAVKQFCFFKEAAEKLTKDPQIDPSSAPSLMEVNGGS